MGDSDDLLATYTEVVHVFYHQLYVAVEDRELAGPPPANGLAGRCEAGVLIATGIHSGPVTVTVEARRSAPAKPQVDWDAIVDVAIDALAMPLRIRSLMVDVPVGFPLLNAAGAGRYVVRVHARGRDTEIDGAPAEPVETYLVQAWPNPAASDAVHKMSDAYGASLRLQGVRHAGPRPGVPVKERRAELERRLRGDT